MKNSKKKNRSLFDSIRKPIAPPTRTIDKNKPDEKARPAKRKVKHKKSPDIDN